jgi:hypothetical protein
MHVPVPPVAPVTMISMRVGMRVSMGVPCFMHMFVTVIHSLVLAAAVLRR